MRLRVQWECDNPVNCGSRDGCCGYRDLDFLDINDAEQALETARDLVKFSSSFSIKWEANDEKGWIRFESSHSGDGVETAFGRFQATNGHWWCGDLSGENSELPKTVFETVSLGSPASCAVYKLHNENFYKWVVSKV